MTLAPTERRRLVSVLTLLGSSVAGERDAAALAADRMVRGRGLDWGDLLACPMLGDDWQETARFCSRHAGLLTAWESQFVANLVRRGIVTKKQRIVLTQIAVTLHGKGAR